jgi:hypothetical protein
MLKNEALSRVTCFIRQLIIIEIIEVEDWVFYFCVILTLLNGQKWTHDSFCLSEVTFCSGIFSNLSPFGSNHATSAACSIIRSRQLLLAPMWLVRHERAEFWWYMTIKNRDWSKTHLTLSNISTPCQNGPNDCSKSDKGCFPTEEGSKPITEATQTFYSQERWVLLVHQ